MDSYIFFSEEDNPQKLLVPPGEPVHTQEFLNGPKAPSYEQYPIRMFEWTNEDGSRQFYLIAYAIEPSRDEIEQAIVKLKLPPTTNYQDEDEDEDEDE